MKKVLDFLKENDDLYADFGVEISIFYKKNDEVIFIGSLDEALYFIEHYN